MFKQLAPIFLSLTALTAQAHPGHGLGDGAHWHASDALIYLGVALVVGAGLWLNGRR